MCKRELKKRRWHLPMAMLGGLFLVVSLALLYLLFEPEEPAVSTLPRIQPPLPPPPAVVQDDPPPPVVEDVPPPVPTVADLAFRCAELLDPVDRGYPNADDASQDCQNALAARFSPARSAAGLLPLARPMTWSDVFEDVAAGFAAVTTALRDPVCQVTADDLLPDLAERCAARDMAELAVLGEVCGRLLDGFANLHHRSGIDPERYLTTLDADARDRAVARLDAGQRFTGNIEYLQPDRVREALNAPLADLGEYWRQRECIDEVYFRTAWLRSRCEDQRGTLAAMLPHAEVLDGLMQHAAGFGDEFALSHSWQGRWRAMELQQSNLLLGWVHLAHSHAAAVQAEWRDETRRAVDGWEEGPYLEARLRVLELAGIDCPSPCTAEQLTATEKRFARELGVFRTEAEDACRRGENCQHADALREVRWQLAWAEHVEGADGRRNNRYGRRVEALRMRFALAVEALAAERGVPLDVAMLRRVLANPEVPSYLDSAEVEHLRTVAQGMAARAIADGRSGVPPVQP